MPWHYFRDSRTRKLERRNPASEAFQRCRAGVYFAVRKISLTNCAEEFSSIGGPSVNIRRLVFRALLPCAAACVLVLLPNSPALAQGQDRAPEYYQADIQYGAQIFATQCTACHGTSGDQVPGVNFRAGIFKRVVTDNDLRATITNGVPGTEMRPFNFGARSYRLDSGTRPETAE